MITTKLSTRSIVTIDSANFRDCVNSGYRWTLYSDGHVAAEYITRWQGSRSGMRYTTDVGYIDVSKIDASNVDTDAEALLTDAVRDVQPDDDRNFRQTRGGWIVR